MQLESIFRQPWYVAAFGETAGAGVLSSILAFMATYHASFAAGQALSHWQARCFPSTRILCNSDHWRVTDPVISVPAEVVGTLLTAAAKSSCTGFCDG